LSSQQGLRTWPYTNTDTGGECIFAEASILTNQVFRHLPNMNGADF
jgi:hypothetical protein